VSLLADRIAVVTGGASGIGSGIVHRFASEGAGGVVLDLPGASVEPPPGWTFVGADVRDDAAVAAAFADVGERHLKIDVLVAAAGIVPGWADLASIELAHWDDVIAVNVRGMLSTFKHALPLMATNGAVVAIGSLNSWHGDPNLASYVASKHAVLGLVRSAALDLGRRGIRVNAVGPGPIATDALLARIDRRERELGIPRADALAAMAATTALGRMATVDEVAGAVLFLASDLASGITGQLLPVDAGFSPSAMTSRLAVGEQDGP
jgi:NAD(P)-dependent dehydrogenase (short-subunit alcohol dehydrogenase family)